MQLSANPNHTQRPPFKRPAFPRSVIAGRWYLPLMATIALGFGVANFYTTRRQSYYSQLEAEEERLRKNQDIMDAYGDKEDYHDIERALAVYDIQ